MVALAPGDGVVSVHFHPHEWSGRGDALVAAHHVRVRPRVALEPTHLTLVPRSSYQLRVNVPRWDEVRVLDPTVASVDPITLRVRGLAHGRTEVALRVVDEVSGEEEETRTTVSVERLHGIELHCANDEVLLGREISVRVVGSDGQTPFSFSGFELEGFSFRWASSNEEVVRVSSPIPYRNHHQRRKRESGAYENQGDAGEHLCRRRGDATTRLPNGSGPRGSSQRIPQGYCHHERF